MLGIGFGLGLGGLRPQNSGLGLVFGGPGLALALADAVKPEEYINGNI